MSRWIRRDLAAWLIAGLASGAFAQPLEIRTLAAKGDDVPGLPGETFGGFGFPQIGPSGRIAFAAEDSTFFDGTYAIDDCGELAPIVRQHGTAPGIPDAFMSFVGAAMPLASGRIGFWGEFYRQDASFGRAWWVWDEGTGATLAARNGMEVDGTGGARLFDVQGGGFTPTAAISWGSLFGGDTTPMNDAAVVRSDASGTRVLIREGAPAPGIPGVSITSPAAFAPDDDDERVLLGASFALYRMGASRELELLIDFRRPLPGIPEADIQSFGPIWSVTQIAFSGSAPDRAPGNSGVWSIEAGRNVELRVREGDAVAAGLVVGDLADSRADFDAAGALVFEADTLNGALEPRSSIVRHDRDFGLELIARSGSAVPGLRDTFFTGVFGDPQANAVGDVVWWGALRAPETPFAEAIFLHRADGGIQVVARVGRRLKALPRVSGRVVSLDAPPICFGTPCDVRVLSDDRQIVFVAGLGGETRGVFVARDHSGAPRATAAAPSPCRARASRRPGSRR